MRAVLLGLSEINFSNNNGEHISGVNIFVGFSDERVQGVRTERFYVREGIALPKDLKLNDDIEIAFNYKGKVESIRKA